VQQDDAVIITYVAGNGSTTASVPADYRHAIKMLATVLYDDRKGEAAEWPLALKTIIDGMRIPRYL
jgi:hypothetical protein